MIKNVDYSESNQLTIKNDKWMNYRQLPTRPPLNFLE